MWRKHAKQQKNPISFIQDLNRSCCKAGHRPLSHSVAQSALPFCVAVYLTAEAPCPRVT